MSKLAKALKAISHIIRKPYLLNHILEDENIIKNEFLQKFPEIQQLKQIPFYHFLGTQPNVTVSPYAYLGGSSLPTDLALLQLLCKNNQVEDYLEIGTWRGESVANVAPFVKNCFSLNLPDETMRTMGLDEDYINMHRYFSMEIKNVTHLFGHSQTFDFEKLNKKFDLIFIDGDHHTEAVENDTKRVLSLLKSDQSIIVWHDAQIDPETPRHEVLMGIFSGIPKEKHKHIYLVSNSLCAVYYPFEVESTFQKANNSPKNYFSVELTPKTI